MNFETIGETTVIGSTTEEYPAPTVDNVRRRSGIAGQFSVIGDVTYPGEPTRVVEFVGSVYGGPVVGIFDGGPQTFISAPDRFGDFATEPVDWFRRFHA